MEIKKKIILVIVLLSYFITAIDGSIVFTGLKMMSDDLNLNQITLSWVQNAYMLTFGGFILLGGQLGDVFGRKKMINLALILFGLGSTLAGASITASIMIFARFLQGIGAAILAPTSLALLMDTFEGDERAKAVAWYSSISGLGSCIGLILGGFLASFTSWRDGFFINIPLTIVMLVLSMKTLPSKKADKHHFDILGTLLSTGGVFSFVYAINGAENFLLWFTLSLLLLAGFVLTELKSSMPLIPLELFKDTTRIGAYITRALYMCAMLGFWFYLSECLQNVFEFSPILTGVAFFPMTISLFVAAIFVPSLIHRYGDKNVLLLGIFFLLGGFIWTLFFNDQSTYLDGILFPLILLGFGQGLSMSPLTNLGIYNTKPEVSGMASGLVNVAHQVGGTIGLSFMIAINGANHSIVVSFHRAMIIGLGFIILMSVASIIFFKNRKRVSKHGIYHIK